MTKKFIDAEWRKLIMANYVVEPSVLSAYLPAKTAFDFYQDKLYVSLIGFMFKNVKVK